MNLENKITIADSLKPTFENVTREFITDTLYQILFNNELPNFKIDFREDEAIEFIEKTLQDYRNEFKEESFVKELNEKHTKILQKIKEKSNNNTKQPVMIVNNYNEFFELLRQFYEKDIELFFKRIECSVFQVYEQKNCFEQIWLRATPDDFNNPEEFLRKQVQMINDKTFEKYDEETYLGKLDFLNDNIICIKNGIARTWDENSREIKITIYDKKHYNNTEIFDRPHYTLPVIRYGIYEKEGKKICYIGSVQNKNDEEDNDNNLIQNINIARKELNKGELKKENYKEKVEPSKTLALSIFINLLNEEGITEIEIPSMYVLDYEYHRKRGIQLKKKFDEEWTEEEKNKHPKYYEREKNYLSKNYEKEDLISEIKTERFIHNVKRLLSYYTNGKIKSYPGELDSFLHMSIPVVKNENEINNNMLRKLYKMVKEKYLENER
jgi:hypothetical protein